MSRSTHQSQREIVEEVIASGRRTAPGRRRSVDAHLIVAFVIETRRRTERSCDVLTGVSEADHAADRDLERF